MNGESSKKLNEVVYKFLNTYKIIIVIISFILFILFCIISELLSSNTSIMYYACVAAQNIFITVFSVFLLDFLINSSYEKKLREDIVDILTTPVLIKDFVKEQKMKEILHYAMDSLLGQAVSNKIEDTILCNYQILDKNCFRKNAYIWIKLSDDAQYPHFYRTTVSINFDIVGLTGEHNFEVYHTSNRKDFDEYVENIAGVEGVVNFPFLMAKDSSLFKDFFCINYFKINEIDVENICTESLYYRYPIKASDLNNCVKVSFEFETYLNKAEKYLFEDIACIYDGFHIWLSYQDTDIQDCNCYSSYKEKALEIKKPLTTQITVNLDGIVLPGSSFVFIWR